MKILGIDPSLVATGWAVIEVEGGISNRLGVGVIKTSAKNIQADRLHTIAVQIVDVAHEYKPNYIAMESMYVGQNMRGAVMTAEVLGVIRLQLWRNGYHIMDYAPTQIKKAIVGKGNAKKDAVAKSVGVLLGISNLDLPHHITDALAVALTHSLAIEAIPF